MDYFDRLARFGLPTRPFANAPSSDGSVGASPLPVFMAPLAQQPMQDAQVVREPSASYDLDPALTHTALASPQQDSIEQAIQSQSREPIHNVANALGGEPIPTEGHDVVRTEKLRADVASILAAPGSTELTRQRLAARMALDGFKITDIGGLEESLRARAVGTTVSVGIANPNPRPKPEPVQHGEDRGTVEAALDGAADSILIGGKDEIAGALRATANSAANLFGKGTGESWGDAYVRERDAERGVSEDAQHYRPGTHLLGQVAGGALTIPIGGGEAALARGGATAAVRLAGEGAALGGAYGFNSSDGDLKDRLINGAKGAGLGAAGSVIIGAPLNSVARRVASNRATPSIGREVLDAADNLSAGNLAAGLEPVRPLAAHTSDGGFAAEATAMLQPTITGGRIGGLNNAMHRFEEQTGNTARRIADEAAGGASTDLSTAATRANDPNVAGSLGAYAHDTETAARNVYAAAETAANGAQVPTPATIARIDETLGEWDRVPGGVAGADALRALRNDLARGPDGGSTSAQWTVDGLRRLRTSFGDRIESGQRQLREAANRVWGPLSDDIFRGLRVAGLPDAARLYRQADRQWAQRSEGMVVIQRLIGRDADLSGDAVAAKIAGMSKNDHDRLGQALNLIDPLQANAIRGGLVNSLGKRVASQAQGRGEFSLESFASRWNKMSDQARNSVFAAQTVRDLDDLARLAGSQRQVNRLGNSSRSGVVNQNWREMRAITVEGAALASGVWNPSVWLGLVSSVTAGRLLATPGFARMLVRASESRSMQVVARRLAEIARRNPAAAQDLLEFKKAVGLSPNEGARTAADDPFAGLPADDPVDLPAASTQPDPVPSDDPFAAIPDDGEYVDL